MFGWRTSPEAALKERRTVHQRELRNNAYKQAELRKAVQALELAIKREKDPGEKRRLCAALVQKRSQLDREAESAVRTQRTMETMERGGEMSRRLDDVQALAASMSAMSRRASPAAVARMQETIITAQSSLDIASDIMDDIDRPAADAQQSFDDQVDEMMEKLDSENALEIGSSLPSFPSIPVGGAPSPHPTVQSIEERLQRLLGANGHGH